MEEKEVLDIKAMGHRIRDEREKLGLSRSDFAELIGLSEYYVGQLERGERQMSLPVLVKIVKCLHISLDYLVFGTPDYNSDYICDGSSSYELENLRDVELYELIKRCSPRELQLIKKLIKTIIPYIR